jgi:hypothetical protein
MALKPQLKLAKVLRARRFEPYALLRVTRRAVENNSLVRLIAGKGEL